MTIAFVTTLSNRSSTTIGRLKPMAAALDKLGHTTSLLLLAESDLPFRRTSNGKIRLSGIKLIVNQIRTVFRLTIKLIKQKPSLIVIAKPLPANTLAVWFYQIIPGHSSHIILDTDDFELTANHLNSLIQRAAIHASERMASRLADHVTAATPFLKDHFEQLTSYRKPVSLLPTGLTLSFLGNQIAPVNKSKQSLVIAYLGSLSISSGHRIDMLPDLLSQLHDAHPDLKLLIAGDGHDQKKLQQAITHLNLSSKVIWHGRFTPNEVPTLINNIDILIDPIDSSLSNRAKSSYRVALATASGRPVVTSPVGIRNLLIPKTLHKELFVPSLDPTGYAQTIRNLIKNPLTLSETQQLIDHSQQFTWDKLAQDFNAILKTL